MNQREALVLNNEQLTQDIFRLTLKEPEIACKSRPGQFVMVEVGKSHSPLLRRPFSVHQASKGIEIQILFKVLGEGTRILSNHSKGESINIVGPLGNGFNLLHSNNICLIGGGMGIAPLLFTAKELLKSNSAINLKVLLGAQTKNELLRIVDDFSNLGVELRLATDDGSTGHKGYIIDLLEPTLSESKPNAAWQVISCGPYMMMNRVAQVCKINSWQCQVSMETMMACGISACLGCTIQSTKSNEKGEHYLHVCKSGPVFLAEDIAWKN